MIFLADSLLRKVVMFSCTMFIGTRCISTFENPKVQITVDVRIVHILIGYVEDIEMKLVRISSHSSSFIFINVSMLFCILLTFNKVLFFLASYASQVWAHIVACRLSIREGNTSSMCKIVTIVTKSFPSRLARVCIE